MKEKSFIEKNIKKRVIESYLAKRFSRAGFSHSIIQRTPLATRVIIYIRRPGIVIGRGGKTIDELSDYLKEKFNLENPQIDVQEVENPDLDANIVASHIASSIERGLNYKRTANLFLQRIMNAGAIGVLIKIGGKLRGEKARTEKFSNGYLKYAGEPAEKSVRKASAIAKVKLGLIGIEVRIMIDPPVELEIIKKIDGASNGDNKEKDSS